jgi:hypothetical protein
MTANPLDSCDDVVQEATSELLKEAANPDSAKIFYAPAYHYLDQFDSEVADSYLEAFPPEDFEFFAARNDFILNMVHIAKMAKKRGKLHSSEHLRNLRDHIARSIEVSGRIQANTAPTAGPFWYLLQFDNISTDISDTVDYLSSPEFIDAQSNLGLRTPISASIAALCLSEHDYFGYQERIDTLSRRAMDCFFDDLSPDPPSLHYTLKAANRSSIDASEFIENARNFILNPPDDETGLSSDEYSDLYVSGHYLPALHLCGMGIKRPIRDSDWQSELENQQLSHVKPRFLTTKPSTRLGERDISIYNQMNEMIEQATKSILISTRGIDLLHEELIDKALLEDDLTIKIVTNKKAATGPRKKMKKAVMNELVNRLGSNVREDQLVHSRMLITDETEMLISSADLTRDQLYDEFNAGIYTKNEKEVERAIEFFESIWEDSDPRGQK